MSALLEDAISFLDRAKKICPDVTHLLTTVQLTALDFDPCQPFPESSVSNTTNLRLKTESSRPKIVLLALALTHNFGPGNFLFLMTSILVEESLINSTLKKHS